MNRRRFVISASVLAAFTGSQALAQRGSGSTAILTSELTGGEIDISGTSLEMVNHHIDEADGSEHLHFVIENDGQFDIYFWPQEIADVGDFTQSLVDMYQATMPGEILNTDVFEDGGFIAFNSYKLGYCEYQRDAYPGHDLIMLMHADADIFEANFNDAQAVLIDGMSPFLFHEDAGILEIAAAEMEKTSSGTTRGSDTAETPESTDTGNSGETTTGTTSDDPVDAVIAHRDQFWDSFGEFYELLDAVAAESATDKEIGDSWTLMLTITADWQNYPTAAAAIEFSREFVGLETAYLDWADSVGLLGSSFEQFASDQATIDDVIAAQDDMFLLADALDLEIEAVTLCPAGFSQASKSERDSHRIQLSAKYGLRSL